LRHESIFLHSAWASTYTKKCGGQNTLRPPTSKSGGTCPSVHPMIDAHDIQWSPYQHSFVTNSIKSHTLLPQQKSNLVHLCL